MSHDDAVMIAKAIEGVDSALWWVSLWLLLSLFKGINRTVTIDSPVRVRNVD